MTSTVRLMVVVVALLVCVAGVVLASNANPSAKPSNEIARNSSFTTYLDYQTVDGKQIPCITVKSAQNTSVSCDWSAK